MVGRQESLGAARARWPTTCCLLRCTALRQGARGLHWDPIGHGHNKHLVYAQRTCDPSLNRQMGGVRAVRRAERMGFRRGGRMLAVRMGVGQELRCGSGAEDALAGSVRGGAPPPARELGSSGGAWHASEEAEEGPPGAAHHAPQQQVHNRHQRAVTEHLAQGQVACAVGYKGAAIEGRQTGCAHVRPGQHARPWGSRPPRPCQPRVLPRAPAP